MFVVYGGVGFIDNGLCFCVYGDYSIFATYCIRDHCSSNKQGCSRNKRKTTFTLLSTIVSVLMSMSMASMEMFAGAELLNVEKQQDLLDLLLWLRIGFRQGERSTRNANGLHSN